MPKKHSFGQKTLASTMAIGFTLGTNPAAQAMDVGQFEPPSLEGYRFVGSARMDKDEIKDGVKETEGSLWKNTAGDMIVRLSIDGHIYAWIFAPTKELPAEERENRAFTIVDSDGDGIFDEKYGGLEKYYLPPAYK